MKKLFVIINLTIICNLSFVAQPIASFITSSNVGCEQSEILFQNTSTGCIDDATYSWDFGNGTYSSLEHVYVYFGEAGFYSITLTVNCDGLESSFTEVILIVGLDAIIASDTTIGYAPLTVNFTDNSVADESISSNFWVFGDGATGSGMSLSHTFNYPGIYNVLLTTYTESGCVNSEILNITVVSEPEISLSISPASGQFVADGSVEVSVSGGIEPFEISCNSAKAQQEFSNLAPGNYTIYLEDVAGHTASEEFTMDWLSQVGFIDNSLGLNIYPNPASDKLFILSSTTIPENIIITNIGGKVVCQYAPYSLNSIIDISQFENGVYIIKIVFKDSNSTEKLFID